MNFDRSLYYQELPGMNVRPRAQQQVNYIMGSLEPAFAHVVKYYFGGGFRPPTPILSPLSLRCAPIQCQEYNNTMKNAPLMTLHNEVKNYWRQVLQYCRL